MPSYESQGKSQASRLQQAGTNSVQQRDFVTTNNSSVWSQILSKVPRVRNTTHYYAHDAIKAATEAVGSVATTIQKKVSVTQTATDKSVEPDHGLSRFAFVDSSKRVATIPRKNSDEFEDGISSVVQQAEINSSDSSTTTIHGTTGKYNNRISAAAAANAASKATTSAAATLATGIYNILSAANMTPELHYSPGEPLYRSQPSSVASFIGTSSPTAVSCMAPFIPPFGHPSPPSPNFGSQSAPPSFSVLSAAIQTVVTAGSNQQRSPLATTATQTNFLSLALQDGFAVFEVDGNGVSEVVAHLRGDKLLTDLLLRHSLDDSGHKSDGTPPQPVPHHFLDVKVVENTKLYLNNIDVESSVSIQSIDDSHSRVTISSSTPLVTLAMVTEPFQHFYLKEDTKETVCDKHQRIMILECLPSCVLEGEGTPSDTSNCEFVDFFAPLPTDNPQQHSIQAQSVGNPFSPYLNHVTSAAAGLLYRVVSSITLVNESTIVSISTTTSTMEAKDVQSETGSNLISSGILTATSSSLASAELGQENTFSVPKRKLLFLAYTLYQSGACSKMRTLRSIVTNNGVNASGGNWVAFAGASTNSNEAGSQQMPGEPQTIFRSEVAQSGKEYYAKAASNGWSKIGTYLGLRDKTTSNENNKDTIVNTDGNFTKESSPTAEDKACPPIGVITLCDTSSMGLISHQSAADSTLCDGYYHDFASFAAHSHPIQCLAFDPSGTMLATASTSGTSVNIYQVSKLQHHVGQSYSKQTPSKLSQESTSRPEFGREQEVLFFDSDDDDDRNSGKRIKLLKERAGGDFVGEVTLLYRLLRGTTSAVITSLAFSPLSAALGIATSLGTCHFHPLNDDHDVAHESQDQVQYYKKLADQANSSTVEEKQEPTSKLNRPFACYRVGIRGELSSLRKAPLTGPICRARSSATSSPPWPLITFRPLPLYRLRAAVSVMRDKKDKLDPNKLGADGHESFVVPVATYDAYILCPSYLSVSHVQFSSEGDAITLSTVSLSQFSGPKWPNGLSKISEVTRIDTEAEASPDTFLGGEAIAWLLQQERHCARSVDYSWAHVGKFAYEVVNSGTLQQTPLGSNISYRWDTLKNSPEKRSVNNTYFLTLDDTELDAIASQAAETEEWDETSHDSPFDREDDDFIVA